MSQRYTSNQMKMYPSSRNGDLSPPPQQSPRMRMAALSAIFVWTQLTSLLSLSVVTSTAGPAFISGFRSKTTPTNQTSKTALSVRLTSPKPHWSLCTAAEHIVRIQNQRNHSWVWSYHAGHFLLGWTLQLLLAQPLHHSRISTFIQIIFNQIRDHSTSNIFLILMEFMPQIICHHLILEVPWWRAYSIRRSEFLERWFSQGCLGAQVRVYSLTLLLGATVPGWEGRKCSSTSRLIECQSFSSAALFCVFSSSDSISYVGVASV